MGCGGSKSFPDGSVVAPTDAALAELQTRVDEDSTPRRKGSLGVVPSSQTEGGHGMTHTKSTAVLDSEKKAMSESTPASSSKGTLQGLSEATGAILEYGSHSNVGNPSVHANEDRLSVALDLLEPHVGAGTQRSEEGVPVVSYFGVYDGHGGSDCAEILKLKLHTICAREIFSNRKESAMKENMVNAYEAAEVELCSDKEAGACSVSTVLRGRKLYTAACGDSMAMLVKYDDVKCKIDGKPIHLNDRHAVYLSKHEKKRLHKAGAEISEDPGIEEALVARRNGFVYKAIYPTRSFGDMDFKNRTHPVKGLIATPTGRGVGHEGNAVELKGAGPWYLIVGCDGLWDFMETPDIMHTLFNTGGKKGATKSASGTILDSPQDMALKLVKDAQGAKFDSDDDVTVIIVKITFPK